MKKITYNCDGCFAEKCEVNHWHSVRVDSAGFTVYPFSENAQKHYCSQKCLFHALSKYLAEVMACSLGV